MEKEKINDIAFQIISSAGESFSNSIEAMNYAEKFDFENAKKKLKLADQSSVEAHKIHSELLFAFANGNPMDPTILLGHAQDHLTKAEIMLVFAEKQINLYHLIYQEIN